MSISNEQLLGMSALGRTPVICAMAKELLARRKAAEIQVPCDWVFDECPVCKAMLGDCADQAWCPGWPAQ